MSDDRERLGVKDPYTGLHPESIYALWHDPTMYDHMTMGPPYLPEMKVRMASETRSVVRAVVQRERQANEQALVQILSHLVGEYRDMPLAEMGALLSCLRAASLIHQSHHWQTRGDTFYGDHLLYMRLYDESQESIDKIAERAVGAGNHWLVHPVIQAGQLWSLVKFFYGDIQANPGPDLYALLSLVAEVRVLALLRMVYEALSAKGLLSPGIDNLLQGVADKHEEFVYLLRQRCSVKVSYDRR